MRITARELWQPDRPDGSGRESNPTPNERHRFAHLTLAVLPVPGALFTWRSAVSYTHLTLPTMPDV